MKTRGRFIIDYIPETSDEDEIPQSVIEFDEFHIHQDRDIDRLTDAGGNVVELIPSPTYRIRINGTRTEKRA